MYDKNVILYRPLETVLYIVGIIEHVSIDVLQSEYYDDILKWYNSYKEQTNRIYMLLSIL